PERRLCAGRKPPDEEIRIGEIRLRPHRGRATRMGGEESVRGLSFAAHHGGVFRSVHGRRSAVALRLRASDRGRAGDDRRQSRPRAEGPVRRAGRPAGNSTLAKSLWHDAPLEPSDIDVASIYDVYPTMVLAQANDLGLI